MVRISANKYSKKYKDAKLYDRCTLRGKDKKRREYCVVQRTPKNGGGLRWVRKGKTTNEGCMWDSPAVCQIVEAKKARERKREQAKAEAKEKRDQAADKKKTRAILKELERTF
jgi:hypothetical protein